MEGTCAPGKLTLFDSSLARRCTFTGRRDVVYTLHPLLFYAVIDFAAHYIDAILLPGSSLARH